MRNYEGKYGTLDNTNTKDIVLNDLFVNSELPELNDTDEALSTPMFSINMEELDKKTKEKARLITERLAGYFFDEKYVDQHPYIKSKIAQEMDNIRRLLKMLAVNEKAQDTLITSISMSSAKGTLYSSLTSLQNSMLQMQSQLNTLTANLENIFKEMQENCEQTFEEKDKEEADDGTLLSKGSRKLIEEIEKMVNGENSNEESKYEIDEAI